MLGLLPQVARAYMEEGAAKGTVVTVGEDRVIVQKDEGGQVTFEVANVKREDQWVKNEDQLAFIKTLKQGDKVEVEWGKDHTGHSFIRSIHKIAAPDTAAGEIRKEGRARGTVITTSGERLVIQKAEGGQMTLEPKWVQVEGKWGRDQEQIAFFRSLKQGDQIEANWRLDEGTHFCVTRIAKLDAEGRSVQPQGRGEQQPLIAELHALRTEIAGLRQEIAALRELVAKLVEQGKEK